MLNKHHVINAYLTLWLSQKSIVNVILQSDKREKHVLNNLNKALKQKCPEYPKRQKTVVLQHDNIHQHG